jgi:hypothetical protein
MAKKLDKKPTRKALIEQFQPDTQTKVRVDRDAGMLYDVLVLGEQSLNGTHYATEVRAKAIPLFENAGFKVNLAHQADRSLKGMYKPTEFTRRIGKLQNIHDTPGGIRADLKILKKHPWAEVIFESAEEMPDMFGLSPVMVGVVGPKDANGREECMSIQHVKCVDVVADPGTTKSLFNDIGVEEGEEETGEETTEQSAEQHYEEACLHAVDDLVKEFFAGTLTPEEVAKKVKEHLKTHAKQYQEEEKDEGEEGEEEGAETEGEESELEEGERTELKILKLEKACRLLCEQHQLAPDAELVGLLSDLPSTAAREKHLNFLKRGSLVKKVKSGIKPAVTNGDTAQGPNYVSILRGN